MEETEQTMELTVGAVLEGKVKSITNFGAFISLPENKTGLVHISEVANRFVSDVHDFLQVGQEVQVKILSTTPEGRINLSVKQAQPRPVRENRTPRAPSVPAQTAPPAEASFEDKLKQFLSASDSKMSELNRNRDNKRGNRRRK